MVASVFGDDSSLHGSALFGSDSLAGSTVLPEDDPWASSNAPTTNNTTFSSVSSLLQGAPIPDIYTVAFDDALNTEDDATRPGSGAISSTSLNPDSITVSAAALERLLVQLNISQDHKSQIYSLIRIPPYDPLMSSELSPRLDRGTWNVALALAGFAQRGSSNLSLGLVDFSRNSLPNLSIPQYQTKLYKNANLPKLPNDTTSSSSSSVASSNNNTNKSKNTFAAPPAGAVWQSSIDPSNYNPLSPNTISVSVVPKREGTLFFRHVNYVVEGLIPSVLANAVPAVGPQKNNAPSLSSTTAANSMTRFKVIRRYSDFDWLLDCLQKKYPFRLLPVLPPKRLSGMYIILFDLFLFFYFFSFFFFLSFLFV